jgi:hypothetical protein
VVLLAFAEIATIIAGAATAPEQAKTQIHTDIHS